MTDLLRMGCYAKAKEPDLEIWTLYNHPVDFPNHYVARRFDGDSPTGNVILAPELVTIRMTLAKMGLVRIDRNAADDPFIIETWL